MAFALTVDVEDWYMTNGFDFPPATWDAYEDRVADNTRKILRLMDEYGLRGTFFILGCVAKKHPNLVKEIVNRGHEIGSHGGWHQLLSRLSVEDFREDVLFSKQVIEEITGQPVLYYRAPSWSMSLKRHELLEVLEELGFVCDSSIQPFRTPLSGENHAPLAPFHPIIDGKTLSLVEFPSTVWNWGAVRFPFSGGFYLRAIPLWMIMRGLKHVERQRQGMIYIHPWELDAAMPRVSASPLIRWIHYYRLQHTEAKLRELFSQFQFTSLGALMKNQSYRAVAITD